MTTTLTPREQEIIAMVWDGLTSREIGAELKISWRTVKAHRASLMKKLRATNTAQLIRKAIDAQLIAA